MFRQAVSDFPGSCCETLKVESNLSDSAVQRPWNRNDLRMFGKQTATTKSIPLMTGVPHVDVTQAPNSRNSPTGVAVLQLEPARLLVLVHPSIQKTFWGQARSRHSSSINCSCCNGSTGDIVTKLSVPPLKLTNGICILILLRAWSSCLILQASFLPSVE